MYRKLVFVLTMFAVAFGSLSQVQAALASSRPAAPVASAAHAGTPASIATHSATGAVRPATARRQMAHRARLRTEQKQGSLPLERGIGERRKRPRRPRSPAPPPLPHLSITSADSTTFTVGQPGTFTVTTTGTLPMSLSVTPGVPPLPSGVTFTDNGNGTATLSGTPAAGTTGTYTFTITATQPGRSFYRYPELHPHGQPGVPDHQPLPAPPLPSARPGPLPSRRPGCPARAHCPRRAHCRRESRSRTTGTARRHFREHRLRATGGTYPFTITATNGATPAPPRPSPSRSTDNVHRSPALPTPPLPSARPGPLPSRRLGCPLAHSPRRAHCRRECTFVDNGNGTATLAGTPARAPADVPVHDHRHERRRLRHPELHPHGRPGVPDHQHPAHRHPYRGIRLASTVTSTVTSTGPPTCSLSATGLPSGVTFTDNGDGTGTISGTPTTAGTYNGHDHCHERCRS